MKPVEFKDQTMVFRKPENMTDKQCQSLPAKQHHIDIEGSKFNAIESVWELTDEEIREVLQSKRIRLRVIASGMPPVELMAEQSDEPYKTYQSIEDINTSIVEGKLLLMAISKLTSDFIKDKEPNDVLKQIVELAQVIFEVEEKEESISEAFINDVNGALEKGENVFDPNTKLWPESTSVARTTLIPEENILEVEYRSGRVYHYKKFPAILFPDVVAAKSIGQFINKNIKGQFEEIEVVNG